MKSRIKIEAQQRFQNELLSDYSPELIAFFKRANWSGRLLDTDTLYASMYHEWDALQKDATDMEEAVRSLDWSVTPYARDGEEPDELAQEVAQVVTEALWHRTAYVQQAYTHTFKQLLGALVHALFRGYNVHEIIWERDGELIYPARYIQLPAQYLAWEEDMDKVDRLLLVRDGLGAEPEPFPERKFIVALNTTGPDHPLMNATFYSLVVWFCAFKFGVGWLMEFCQQYGMPTKVFEYGSEEEKEELIDSLADRRVINAVFVQEGRKYEVVNTATSGASLPQRDLLTLAEGACHKLILGQTLTSDTSDKGGSLAQAKVHAGVQADVVLKRAEYVAEILNSQLIPAIVEANYGKVDGLPIPELSCKLPQAMANAELATYWQTVLQIPGMRVRQSDVYESLRIAQPTEADAVFEAQGGQQGMPGMPDIRGLMDMTSRLAGDEQAEEPDVATAISEEPDVQVAAAKAEAPANALADWLAPLKAKLKEARKNGASFDDLRVMMTEWRPNTQALAKALQANVVAGFRQADLPPRDDIEQKEQKE